MAIAIKKKNTNRNAFHDADSGGLSIGSRPICASVGSDVIINKKDAKAIRVVT